ncbi:heavy metal translocating P-type ATPase [Acaryochloris sp. CCMEE 5410]|uniref:heavy metal translocating P-type ATPase n=1 Tax=Acaryochloris sp. CCMEE 5410 TaxID=310037 RepID=UPI000493FA2E|nr:heavy metal translocating P-type ATPase [Acaryochloris sp. CCMEE 5410]KAI9130072.1 heavy metal translocating P-type ATPase [Acaryochloris sp. CCMEE 5410]
MQHQHHHGHNQHSHGSHGGHDKHAGHSPEMFKNRFFICLVLTIPVLYFSPAFQAWFNYQAIQLPGSNWINPILATVIYFYGGWVFIRGSWREIKGKIGMMTLISLAITVAFVYSLAVTIGLEGEPFFWELVTLIDIMLLGHWIEMASVQGASRALEQLAKLMPSTAHRLIGSEIEDVPLEELREGDLILIRPGEQVPIDGVVVEGASSANEAFLTGESRPVNKREGDEVVTGAVNGEGALKAEVIRTGDQTALSQIMRLVEEAQNSRSKYQVLADKAAYWLTLIAIAVGTLTFVVWLSTEEGLVFAINRTVTVLVIACPHALGLAIPLVIVNGTAIAAKNGILVRNREAFERAKTIKYAAFDKTGTLTEGRFGVQRIYTEGLSDEQALAIATALESLSEHPLAQAVVEAAHQLRVQSPTVNDFKAVPGMGVEGVINGKTYRVGRPEWPKDLGFYFSSELERGLAKAESRGESVIALMDENQTLALFALADRVRDSARELVHSLDSIGVQVAMITGDAKAVAQAVATDLGIKRFYARVLPQDKVRIVKELKAEGATVFTGDGINDAPALLEADLGVAIGAGTNVAIESADLVLVKDNPMDVGRALKLGKATNNKMIQNLFWATGYNVIAIPLAAGVAYPLGFVLSPAVGAVFMSLSTVIVSLNAVTLRRVRLN